jgi:serine/threonine protein kinase
LTDFGLSKAVELVTSQTLTLGTLRWAAPEVLSDSKWSDKADIYSLGTVFFEIVSCEIPFQNNNLLQITKGLERGTRPKIPESCPKASIHISFFTCC